METSKSEIQTLKEPNRVKEQQMNGTQNVPTSKKISKQESEEKNESYCIICLDNKKNIVFLPCAHFVSCMECGLSMKNCPVCRTKIQATVRTFS
jgi:L-lactate utilization protein LutB